MSTTIHTVFVLLDVVLWGGAVLGVAIDVISCRLFIRRRRLGHGPSGVPVLAWFLYVLRIAVRPLDMIARIQRPWYVIIGAVLIATAFHALCQVIVPLFFVRRTPSMK